MTFKISVVICTYNRQEFIEKALESLVIQDYSKSDFQIIVVNNNSTDSSLQLAMAFRDKHPDFNITVVTEKQQGLSFARNRGIKESTSDIIIFMDDDAFALPGYLKTVEKVFADYPESFAGGGKVIPVFEGRRPKWMSKFLLPLVAAVDFGDKIKTFPKGKFPVGANMFFKKEVFERFGVFDGSLGRTGMKLYGSEEKDLFYRLSGFGAKVIYTPEAAVKHIVPQRRVQVDYIKKQAEGIGISERLRVSKLGGGAVIRKVFLETVKTIGTIALALLYLLILQPQKGLFLAQFRVWVLKGYLKRVKD